MIKSISSSSLDLLESIYASTFGPNNSLPWVEIIVSIFVIKYSLIYYIHAPSHYDILEVSHTASPEVIRAAYRSLMQRYHPDKNPGRNARHASM